MKNLTAIAFLVALCVAHNTQAWSGAGHQVIAAEAYRQFSPALKAEVTGAADLRVQANRARPL